MPKAPRRDKWKRLKSSKAAQRQPERHRYCHACRQQKPFLGAKVIPSRTNDRSGDMICGECWEKLGGDQELFLAYVLGFERILQRAASRQ